MNHHVLQKIIDNHFDTYTHKTYRGLLAFYSFGFILPFILQMNSVDENFVLWSNISCLIVSTVLVYFRINLLFTGSFTSFKQYFTVFTIVNLLHQLTYFGYFIWRIQNLSTKALPNISIHNNIRREVSVSCSTVVILFGIIFILMELIQYLETFPHIFILVIDVIGDVKDYSAFLFIWILIFAFFY